MTTPLHTKSPALRYAAGILLSLTGCGLPALVQDPKQFLYLNPPAAAHSKEFEVAWAGFLVETKTQPIKVMYELSLHVRKAEHPARYLTVEYDDPKHRHQQIVQSMEVPAGTRDISLQSPPIEGLKSGWDYRVTVKAYADAERSQEVDRLTQRIRSKLDWSRLRKRNFVPG